MSPWHPCQIRKIMLPASLLTAVFCQTNTAHASSQGLNLADRFNNAIEAVQEGIDLIWPGDLDSEQMNARMGIGFGWIPDYVGSDNYRFRAVPILDVRYKEIWRLNGSKLTYTAFKTDKLEIGPLLNLHFGRKESSNKALTGLGDIGTTFDVGIFARFKRESLLIDADIRRGLGAGQGTTIRLTAGHGIYQNGDFAAGLGVRLRYMSKKGMQTNFGITREQAENSVYETFQASAGLSEVSANLIGAYRLTEKARLMGLVSVGHLLGDAADSPIVADGTGSPLQAIAGVGLTFQF
ncbi:MipA/OmpV family protein [Kordiimonas lacus]|uniref:Outer membrane scaffolding protein for murein synthesis, MipA/OmpV family n=1 Tax=Kordiimonas lacus TaxID=637679 RepID=A0A1G6UAS8_9PROT|nr:MipA/OmpV family protein [Kordiimonas lacus]SDD38500.1 Outer membrane scaffolding protein for murein synthesis, MipA/OmpV family [Kordiimonas lacus]